MKPYKINITIMSRNEEAEILDKQILVQDLADLLVTEMTDWGLVNKDICALVLEAQRNEKEEGLDNVFDSEEDYERSLPDTYDGGVDEPVSETVASTPI